MGPLLCKDLLFSVLVVCIILHASVSAKTTTGSSKPPPPHVLFVLVDDLGWGNVGFLRDAAKDPLVGTEIQTPTMDRLATKEGMILHRHYVHMTCTGTRVSLQSGRFPVHVQTSLKNPEEPNSGMPRNMTALGEHMQRAGYKTHYVGKWDVGMATPKHTPYGRGYDTSLNYFEHKNDYWTQHCMQSTCCQFDDKSKKVYNLSLVDLWDTHQPAKHLNGSDYEEFIFLRRMESIIRSHKNASEPLFLFYAPHVAHCPLQVPQEYLDKFDFMDDDEQYCTAQTPNIVPSGKKQQPKVSCRKQYHAMVNLLDDILARLEQLFKSAGFWDNTLVVFTSDNGGPAGLAESGSTNFDLRGAKYSDWEGGIRAAAFVSGGYIPKSQRNKVVMDPIHITDWHVTLPKLAGLDIIENNKDDQQHNFPPVDALNVWPFLSGQVDQSPRFEIPVSKHTLIQGNFKLIWNTEKPVNYAGWTGSIYPNASSRSADVPGASVDCHEGCLYNVCEDRGEHVDLAHKLPVKVQSMKQRLIELRRGFFENNDTGIDSCPPDIEMPCACWMAVNYYGGFLGPYQEVNL